jgi:hypothetical protein
MFLTGAYKSAPSPLRRESKDVIPKVPEIPSQSTSSSPTIARPISIPDSQSSHVSPPSPASSQKPSVRFAEEEKDDSVPLEYVLRIKQARDKKARFLAAERARRLSTQERISIPRYVPTDDLRRIAEDRKQLEEERRQLEEERRKLEMERVAQDRARRSIDEQRKRQMYADGLQEARRRQEKTRQGTAPKLTEGASWEGDRERERERRSSDARASYMRPGYDGMHLMGHSRQSLEANIPQLGGGSASGSRLNIPSVGSSPGNSRPPSIVTGSIRSSSRTPSMYSTPPSSASATDVRTRRESKSSRQSFISEGSYSPSQMLLPPGTPTGYPWGIIPPVPALPTGVMGMPMMQVPTPFTDMPLLPPTPPFVLQQYGQRQGSGQRSHSSSPTRSSDSYRRQSGGTGRASPHDSRRQTPSDDIVGRGRNGIPSSYIPAQASSRSSRVGPQLTHSQSYTSVPTPPMTSSWPKQPSFQNLSRPSTNRRQTMIT